MTLFRTVATLLLVAATAAAAAEVAPPRVRRTAIVIAEPEKAPGGPVNQAAFSLALNLAVRHHVRGYLEYRGEDFELYAVPGSREQAIASVAATVKGEFSRVVYLSVTGRRIEEPALRIDSHRRRYFTKVRGCLELALTVVDLRPKGYEWRVIDSTTIRERSRILAGKEHGPTCEGFEPVVERAITEALGPAHYRQRDTETVRNSLPTAVYIPGQLIQDSTMTAESVAAIIRLAGKTLAAQFGTGLKISSVQTLPAGLELGGDIREGQQQLRRHLRPQGDTLVVVVNRQLSRDEYQSGHHRDELGLSRLGRRQVLLNLVPRTSPDDTAWYTLANSLTLLHEIGHTLGAIHVSDLNSVMTPYATWVGADRFDPVNEKIIRAALDGRLSFDDPVRYLAFVSKTLNATAYNLADYPAFFYNYLNYRANRRIADSLRAAIRRPSYLRAADGYGLLMAGNRAGAAQQFRRALRDDPHQAALYYYLSQATNGAEAADTRRTALRMGYLNAQDEPKRARRADVDNGRQ